jgi:hypothetical protein
MSEKLISELLDLPEKVRKGDFVLNLARGVTEPDKTLEQYVVTPQLVGCFDDALSFIGETAGQSFQTMLEHDAHELGLTLEDVRNWTPPEKKGGRRKAERGMRQRRTMNDPRGTR